jgi:hypothetical protein
MDREPKKVKGVTLEQANTLTQAVRAAVFCTAQMWDVASEIEMEQDLEFEFENLVDNMACNVGKPAEYPSWITTEDVMEYLGLTVEASA